MKNFKHKSATGSLEGTLLDSGEWQISGDIEAAKQEVKKSKDLGRNRGSHYQHMAEIPMVIVLELQIQET